MKWVVVGAGSGGCVAARRLHDAGHHVVLVETGPPLEEGRVPASIDGDDSFAALAEPGRTHDDTAASRTAGGHRRWYARGRGVGGSSAVNAMVALDGDLDLYRRWGWADVEEMFGRILVPSSPATPNEIGRVDRLLLEASDRARRTPLTRVGGRRITVAEAYVWPIAGSDRCDIRADTTVDRIATDASGCAVGVRLATGETVDADAVVLAAGALHTPAILLRSELGGPSVGTGLADHPAVGFALSFPTAEQGGLSTSVVIVDAAIQMLAVNHLADDAPGELGMLLVALMRPESHSGTVRLRSDDPSVAPTVDFDLFSDRRDVAALRAGVRDALDLLSEPSIRASIENVFIDDRGTTVEALVDDAAIDAWITSHGADYVHAACSCSEITDRDDGAVHGVERLFVADASAFPQIPDANTHRPTMMLAERFAARWTAPGSE